MTTIIPIIMPVHTEPEKCPNCHRVEDKKEVCRNCGYEYKETEYRYPFWWLCILIDILLIYGVAFVASTVLENMEWWGLPTIIITTLGAVFFGIVVWLIFAKELKNGTP